MNRLFLVVAIIVAAATLTRPGTAQSACRPKLAFQQVEFSEMLPPTLERIWRAVISVDATGCAPDATGFFEIGFSRLKEYSPELEFRERFPWQVPAVTVEVVFSSDEAVDQYWIHDVGSCPCPG